MTARFTVHLNFGGSVTATLGAGAITANTCNGNAAFTGNYTVEGCPPSDHYVISQIGGSIVPGTTDIGNHGDDTVTTIALPFSYTLYDQTFNASICRPTAMRSSRPRDTTFTNHLPAVDRPTTTRSSRTGTTCIGSTDAGLRHLHLG